MDELKNMPEKRKSIFIQQKIKEDEQINNIVGKVLNECKVQKRLSLKARSAINSGIVNYESKVNEMNEGIAATVDEFYKERNTKITKQSIFNIEDMKQFKKKVKEEPENCLACQNRQSCEVHQKEQMMVKMQKTMKKEVGQKWR